MSMAPMLLSLTGDRPAGLGRTSIFKRFTKGITKAAAYTPQAMLARKTIRLFKQGKPARTLSDILQKAKEAAEAKKEKKAKARTITPEEKSQVAQTAAAPAAVGPGPAPEETAPEETAPEETAPEEAAPEEAAVSGDYDDLGMD